MGDFGPAKYKAIEYHLSIRAQPGDGVRFIDGHWRLVCDPKHATHRYIGEGRCVITGEHLIFVSPLASEDQAQDSPQDEFHNAD